MLYYTLMSSESIILNLHIARQPSKPTILQQTIMNNDVYQFQLYRRHSTSLR